MNEIILEVAALLVALFCLIDSLRKRKRLYIPAPVGIWNKLRDQHYTYMALLVTLIISSVASVAEVILEDYMSAQNTTVLVVLNQTYFIFHTILSFLFTLYIINMTEVGREKNNGFFFLFLSPFFAGEVLIFTNPFTRFIFYIDEEINYTRGEFIWVLYAIAAFYVLFGVYIFVKYRKRLTRMDRSATLILISIAIMGIIIQCIWSITVELFFEAIGFLGFMLLLEDRDNEKVKRHGSRLNTNFILVIALIFITVITININLIYHAGTDQTGKIGTIQLDNIKGNLQETLSDAEGNLLRFSMGMEQLIGTSNQRELEKYIRDQKRYNFDLTGGNCFNVYASSKEWTIIPDFDMPTEYHATERVWYLGASQNAGEIYISDPYIDAATGELCFTLSDLLSDGQTVCAMDYTFSRVQDTIAMMSEYEDQTALIVTEEGTIIGSSDMKFQGVNISEALPEFVEIFDRVKASNEHGSFTSKIAGKNRIIFSNETSNGWQMILIVDYETFYADIYRQMIMLGAIDLLMVAVIIVFYMVSLNNQDKAENTLAATETFISGLSEDFMSPVNNIVKTSEIMLHEEERSAADSLRDIRESGLKLKEMMDDLFSYSGILKSEAEEISKQNKKKEEKKSTFSSKYIRNGIVGILAVTLIAGLILCLTTTTKWGRTNISKEADKYNSEVTQWMLQHQSILRMFTDVIAANPSILDDYDSAVQWLDDIGKNYSEMSACYMANPYKEHPVIMNNGWVPEPDYRVEQRQWYLDTERSGNGFSISSPYYDAQTGLYCITFSRIVYSKDGEFLGIFAIDCYVDKLIDVLDDSYTNEGYAFLIDPEGNILNHPNKDFEMSTETCVNIEDTIYASAYHDGDIFGMKDFDKSLVSCYSEKSEMSGFTVMVVQRWWSVYGTVIIMAIIFLVMLVISIIAVVAMISKFIKWQEEANKRLVEAAETAVSAGKAKSRFLAQMSHEIRTPINAVLGMNEMVLRESNDESIKEYAVNIQSAGRNLLSLINSILDFSKIEEGKMEIIPVKYDTSTMIETLINSVSQRAEDKGLIFETHIDENIPSGLYGDDVRVAQVAVNLLTNAVKYTNKGRVTLDIAGETRDESIFKLSVKVKDTGIGIKQEDLGKMFESFTRLEETRNRAIEGTGLGMSIVIRLLEMMGSKLEVQSEYGKGSEFSFVVDQMITDGTPIGDFKQKAKAVAEQSTETNYLYAPEANILVVDDNEMNLKVIKNLLKLNGIKPDMVDSGSKALEKLSEYNYDIVLLDHMMPEMDGIETLAAAKQGKLIPEGTTVVALTANAVVGARESYLEAGFDDYLSKPVEVKALEEVLAKYLPQEIVSYMSKEDIKREEAKKNEKRKIVDGKPEERRHEDRRHMQRRHDLLKNATTTQAGPEENKNVTENNDDLEILEFMPEGENELDNRNSDSASNVSMGEDEILEFGPENGDGDDEILEFEPQNGDEESSGDTKEKDTFGILEENGISTSDGLNYCAGDPDFYREMLSDYVSSMDERIGELENALGSSDLSLYSIKVHALKSVAKTVGDRKVFELALALENDSKAGDGESVGYKHPALIKEYRRKAEIIDNAL